MTVALIPPEAIRNPHIPRPVDNTALDAYMSCPRKYYYSMVLNRRRTGSTKPALAYGTAWHAGMEAHYKTGGDHRAVIDAIINAWVPHENPDDHRTVERCLREYESYIRRYGEHDAETRAWGSTVGFPETPIVETSAEVWWPGALHPYTGKIDRIFTLQGLFYVEDHKTTSAMGAYYFQQFDPSNQMMGYAVLAQELSGLPIAGVRINAHAVLKTQSKFERQIVTYSQDRLDEWKCNYNVWVTQLAEAYRRQAEGALIGDGVHDDTQAVQAIHDGREAADVPVLEAFPHNFNACAGKYGPCQYVGVCTFPERLRPRILEAEYSDDPWNPLAPDDAE